MFLKHTSVLIGVLTDPVQHIGEQVGTSVAAAVDHPLERFKLVRNEQSFLSAIVVQAIKQKAKLTTS